MIAEVTDEILNKMLQAIVDSVDPVQIILFGSRSRGDNRLQSDIDLLVVEEEPFSLTRSRREEIYRIRKALSGFRIAKDILLFSREEAEHWRNSLNHVIAQAYREGIILYERP